MRWLVLALALAGCARAGKENVIIGGLVDAGPRDAKLPPPDAMVDTPAVQADEPAAPAGAAGPVSGAP
jgi:hypothetical protein